VLDDESPEPGGDGGAAEAESAPGRRGGGGGQAAQRRGEGAAAVQLRAVPVHLLGPTAARQSRDPLTRTELSGR